jgi:RNA polymerase sigma-70 factor, ECF subfamily
MMNAVNNNTTFEQRVLEYSDSLMYQAKNLTRSMVDAEDLVQETLLKAFNNKDKFVDERYIKAWLSKIMTNVYIDKYRTKRYQSEDTCEFLPENDYTMYSNEAETLLEDENVEAFVYDSLCDKPDLLNTFNLFRSDYSYKEISDMLDIPEGTVKSRLNKAKTILRDKITNR